ncbi:MAG TPA: hypothetical protein VFG47_10150 [Geminicoccaceae bacterium]|nr:hypothetical protein [Geminicoccaceae bacterium]
MADLKLGATAVVSAFLGSTPVARVYLGSTLIRDLTAGGTPETLEFLNPQRAAGRRGDTAPSQVGNTTFVDTLTYSPANTGGQKRSLLISCGASIAPPRTAGQFTCTVNGVPATRVGFIALEVGGWSRPLAVFAIDDPGDGSWNAAINLTCTIAVPALVAAGYRMAVQAVTVSGWEGGAQVVALKTDGELNVPDGSTVVVDVTPDTAGSMIYWALGGSQWGVNGSEMVPLGSELPAPGNPLFFDSGELNMWQGATAAQGVGTPVTVGLDPEDLGGIADPVVVAFALRPNLGAGGGSGGEPPPPVAVDDSGFTAIRGGTFVDIDVLDNDTYAGTPEIAVTVQPTLGSATVVGVGVDSRVRYVPPASGTGVTSLTYNLSATGNTGSDTATVGVTVEAPIEVPAPAWGVAADGKSSGNVNTYYNTFVTRVANGVGARGYAHYRNDAHHYGDQNEYQFGTDRINGTLTWMAGDPAKRIGNWNWGPFSTGYRTSVGSSKQALINAANGALDTAWRNQKATYLARCAAMIPAAHRPVRSILCFGIEMTGTWYDWSVGWDGAGATQDQATAQAFGAAFRRFVRVWMEDQGDPRNPSGHRMVFAWAGTHQSFRSGTTWTNFRNWTWPGDDYCDLIMPTWYDTCWDAGSFNHASATSGFSNSQRDTWFQNRWNADTAGKLSRFKDYIIEHNKYGGFHELNVFSTQSGLSESAHRNTPITWSSLNQSMGGDNPVFVQNMYNAVSDPANRLLLPNWFSQLGYHTGPFYGSNGNPDARHPRAFSALKTRWNALPTVGNGRDVVDFLIGRRSATWGS